MNIKAEPKAAEVAKFRGKLDPVVITQAMAAQGLVDPILVRRLRSEHAADPQIDALRLFDKLKVKMSDSTPFDAEAVVNWLCQRFGLSKVPNYRAVDAAQMLAASVAEPFAKRYAMVPLAVDATTIVIGTIEPFDRAWLPIVAKTSQREVKVELMSPTALDHMFERVYKLARSLDSADNGSRMANRPNQERLVEVAGLNDGEERNLTKLVDWLLNDAVEQGASDIHLQPERHESKLRFRIDGQLQLMQKIPAALHTGLLSRIKHMAGLDVVEHRRPQDGRMRVRALSGVEYDVRVSLMPTAFGEKAVLRVLDGGVLNCGVEQLGMDPEDQALWKQLLRRKNGLVLVTGPTGSGKTTTLYASLQGVNRPGVNICTIEDPVEYIFSEFAQMQVNHSIGLDFASGIKTLLRQDPDVLMVGEIRDAETANMAVQAALTGHLVLATLHTNDAPGAVARLRDLGVAPYLIEATLLGVLAQRLMRTLCPHCAQGRELAPQDWDDAMAPLSPAAPTQTQHPTGCESCKNTGYKGRSPIFEIFATAQLSDTRTLHEATNRELRQVALAGGMQALRARAMQKVAQGETSLEEALAVTPSVLGF